MPTPESAAFLAKKPTVAPTFDGVNYDDNKQLKQAQDAIIREQWVQIMMGRLVREELSKCYYREGVNHLEKCGHLRGQYGQGQRKTESDFMGTVTSRFGCQVDSINESMADEILQNGILTCLARQRFADTSLSNRTTSRSRSKSYMSCKYLEALHEVAHWIKREASWAGTIRTMRREERYEAMASDTQICESEDSHIVNKIITIRETYSNFLHFDFMTFAVVRRNVGAPISK